MSKICIAGPQLATGRSDNLDSMEVEIESDVSRFPGLDMVLLGDDNYALLINLAIVALIASTVACLMPACWLQDRASRTATI